MVYLRKSTLDMTPDDWGRFRNVWNTLNTRGTVNRYVTIHANYAEHTMDGMRMGVTSPLGNNLLFLFWHAQFVRAFEAEMHAIDDAVVLPYWDCTREPQGPPALRDFFPPVIVEGGRSWQPTRSWGRNTGPPSSQTISRSMGAQDFARFSADWEDGYHNQVHNYIGGTMARMAQSPGDPLFWVHHGFIDQVWVAWRANKGLPAGMPRSDTPLQPWNVSCINVYSNSDYTYVPQGQRLVGLKLADVVPTGVNQIRDIVKKAAADIKTYKEHPLTLPPPPSSLLPSNNTPVRREKIVRIEQNAPHQSRGYGVQVAPQPRSGSLCKCGRPHGHPRRYRY